MAFKAKIKASDCTLWLESGGDHVPSIGGWPNELNGTYIAEQDERRD